MQWPLWEKPFVELSTLQNFLHFYCTNLRPNLSAQLWWPEFAQIHSWHHFSINIKTLLFQVPSAMSLPPKLPTSIFLQFPNVPEITQKRRRPELPWSRPASAGSANLCYSDDTLSPAIVLLLWCYSPLSLVFECYSSCAIATTPFCLVPDCFDLFHKVEILHLAQQGIAASLSECPWLTPTPVIIITRDQWLLMITAACMCDAQTWGAATAQLISMSMSAMLISKCVATLKIPQVGAGCLSAAYLGLTWLADQLLWSSVKKAKKLISNWSDMKLISWEVVSPYTEVVEKLRNCAVSQLKN